MHRQGPKAVHLHSGAAEGYGIDWLLGGARLAIEKIIENLTFKVKQMPGLLYGRDYFLGDKVTAKYLDQSFTPKVAVVVMEQAKRVALNESG